MKSFVLAFDFSPQDTHLFDIFFHIHAMKTDKAEAQKRMKVYLHDANSKTKAFLIPAKEEMHWLLLRVEMETDTIFILDCRDLRILRNFKIVAQV